MICSGLSSTLETDYGYDAYGRMNAVSNGVRQRSATVTCPIQICCKRQIFSNSSSAVLTTARQWDYGFRLGSIANVVNGATRDIARLHLRQSQPAHAGNPGGRVAVELFLQ